LNGNTTARGEAQPFYLRGELTDLAANEMVVVGMALGHADAGAPEKRLATTREPVTGFAKFSGFE
jgi:hypothetical protein